MTMVSSGTGALLINILLALDRLIHVILVTAIFCQVQTVVVILYQ